MKRSPSILGLDTATAATAVCLLRSDGEAFEVEPDAGALMERPVHGRELLTAIVHVMEAGGVGFGDLAAIAVGVGPGGFTGLRIGIATARALAQADGLGLRPVSSLEALATGIAAPLVMPLIDARRGELFAALYEQGHELWEPFVASPKRIAARVNEAGLRPVAAGDGALRSRQALESAGIEVAGAGARSHVVRALHMCRLAAAAPDLPPEAVVPHYLRAPDAQPTR